MTPTPTLFDAAPAEPRPPRTRRVAVDDDWPADDGQEELFG